MVAGTIYETNNFGSLEIISYHGWDNVEILFIDTNTSLRVRSERIRSKSIKDPCKPSIYGIGFIGVGEFSGGTGASGVHSTPYKIWHGMFKRCYGVDYPSYRDCSVCPEWHNYQNFAKWYKDNHPNDGVKYDLDKDIKINGNRVYSPNSCSFVTPKENKQKAHAITIRMITPKGDEIAIHNISKFCRDNKLSASAFCSVNLGNKKSYRGWTKAN